jgi:hypothetical protein
MRRKTAAGAAEEKAPTRKRKTWSVPLAHPTYVIDPCPNCDYPEADGGYCPECGWSRPLRVRPSQG